MKETLDIFGDSSEQGYVVEITDNLTPMIQSNGYNQYKEERCYWLCNGYIIFKTEYSQYFVTLPYFETYLNKYNLLGNFPYSFEISEDTIGKDKINRLKYIELMLEAGKLHK